MARSFLTFLHPDEDENTLKLQMLHSRKTFFLSYKIKHIFRFLGADLNRTLVNTFSTCQRYETNLRLSLIQSLSLSPGSSIQLARLRVSMEPSIA